MDHQHDQIDHYGRTPADIDAALRVNPHSLHADLYPREDPPADALLCAQHGQRRPYGLPPAIPGQPATPDALVHRLVPPVGPAVVMVLTGRIARETGTPLCCARCSPPTIARSLPPTALCPRCWEAEHDPEWLLGNTPTSLRGPRGLRRLRDLDDSGSPDGPSEPSHHAADGAAIAEPNWSIAPWRRTRRA